MQPTVRLAAHVEVIPANFDQTLPPLSRSTGVWAWPLALVALIGTALLYLFFHLIRRRSRRRRAHPTPQQGPAA